jgi:Pre-mRNA splicing factor PRP21 like protein
MAMIDWNDFQVVQTIDFDDREGNLPAPVDTKEIKQGLNFKFNKDNINPEFSFLIDAYNRGKFDQTAVTNYNNQDALLGKRGY